jgi:autotransporter-associated beta strand protein
MNARPTAFMRLGHACPEFFHKSNITVEFSISRGGRSFRMRMHLKSCLRTAALLAAGLGISHTACASVWNVAGSGDFGNPGNWTGGVPNGSSAIADFSQVDLPTDASVTLNTPITLGQLLFGDTGLGSAASWELRTDDLAGAILTLDNGANKPIIRVNELTPTTFDDAFIAHSLAGTNGFRKTGVGIATLGQGTTSTITGGIDIEEGTLRINAAVPVQTISIANGATLHPNVSLDATGTRIFSVASGATANLTITGSVEVGRFDAAGANINVNFPANAAAGARFTPSGNWLASGATANPAAFVINSALPAPTPLLTPSVSAEIAQTGAVVRLAPNLSSSNGGIRNFNANTFANTPVTLNNTLLYARTNSGGNTFNFGSLSGDATAILSGGNQGAHATYSIGALNTDTTFAGTIDMATSTGRESTGANTGGLNLTKVGTGKLTLSGTLNYPPTANGTVNRRGGITTVSAGTLALTNNAAIAGGINDATVGDVLSTVNIQAGATLDVSGYSGSYSTAPIQQVVGAGTVVGNYTHDEGIIRPANTINGTTASGTSPSVPAGGAINFANNFTWNGGSYNYDLTLDPNTGNDLISVGGTATITNGTVTPNFLGGIPVTGTYTLLTANSISGSAAGITISWPGRSANPVAFIQGNSLKFNAPGVSSANLTWVGNNGPNWDVETTANWTGASPNTFYQSDSVTFNDSATSFTVDIASSVQPTAVTVNNSTNAYTIAGTGGIGGSATFTKTGSGALTMTTANTFSGAASITGGSVDIGNAPGALGTGVLTLTNTSLTVANTSTASLTNSGLAVAAGSSTITVNGTSVTPLTMPAVSGSGNLTLTSTTFVDPAGGNTGGKNIDFGTNGGFTGNLNLVGAVDNDGSETIYTTDTMVVRMNGTNSSLPDSKISLTQGASLRDRATGVATITLGALEGDATATLYGYQGGSGARQHTWRIGALNTDTTFAGVVRDSAGSNSTTAPVNVVKIGTGELELSGANTYTGDTTVEAGTLSIAQPYLADGADVFIRSGSVFNLNFNDTDTIDSLYLGNTPQNPGTYGSLASSATFKSAFFTGTGILSVTTLGAPITIPGDFDNDGDVDGRDFLVWQRGGSPTALSAADLATWQANYGNGALGTVASATTVPEPTGIVLVIAGLAMLVVSKRD